MTTVIHLGSMKEVEVGDIKLVVHIRANPIEEARMIDILVKTGWSQTQIANLLELGQTTVSKRLKLLELIPPLQEMVKKGTLDPSLAYYIARAPAEKQRERLKHLIGNAEEAREAD